MNRRDKVVLTGVGILGSGVCAGVAGASASISVMPDPSLLWQIVNFLVLIWILNLVLYRPIRNVIAQRQEKVAGLDKSIARFEQDTREREKAHAEGLEAAKADGKKEKALMIEEATAEEAKIVEAINREAQQKIVENKEQIAKDVERAAADLQAKVDGFAAEIGQKILGREIV